MCNRLKIVSLLSVPYLVMMATGALALAEYRSPQSNDDYTQIRTFGGVEVLYGKAMPRTGYSDKLLGHEYFCVAREVKHAAIKDKDMAEQFCRNFKQDVVSNILCAKASVCSHMFHQLQTEEISIVKEDRI